MGLPPPGLKLEAFICTSQKYGSQIFTQPLKLDDINHMNLRFFYPLLLKLIVTHSLPFIHNKYLHYFFSGDHFVIKISGNAICVDVLDIVIIQKTITQFLHCIIKLHRQNILLLVYEHSLGPIRPR